jgi:hypothetical protein
MSKVPFTKADVVRTIESAKAAGVTVHVVEVVTPSGTTIRVLGSKHDGCCHSNPWDEVLDEQNPAVRPPLDR